MKRLLLTSISAAIINAVKVYGSSSVYCDNNKSYEVTIDGVERNCQWIRDQSDSMRKDLCQEDDIRIKCKRSCGICCEDNPFYRIKDPDTGRMRNCNWIGEEEERKNAYCPLSRRVGSVRDSCPVACDFCAAYIHFRAPNFPPAKPPSSSQGNSPVSSPESPGSPNASPTQDDERGSAPADGVIEQPDENPVKGSFPYAAVFGSIGGLLGLALLLAAYVFYGKRRKRRVEGIKKNKSKWREASERRRKRKAETAANGSSTANFMILMREKRSKRRKEKENSNGTNKSNTWRETLASKMKKQPKTEQKIDQKTELKTELKTEQSTTWREKLASMVKREPTAIASDEESA